MTYLSAEGCKFVHVNINAGIFATPDECTSHPPSPPSAPPLTRAASTPQPVCSLGAHAAMAIRILSVSYGGCPAAEAPAASPATAPPPPVAVGPAAWPTVHPPPLRRRLHSSSSGSGDSSSSSSSSKSNRLSLGLTLGSPRHLRRPRSRLRGRGLRKALPGRQPPVLVLVGRLFTGTERYWERHPGR